MPPDCGFFLRLGMTHTKCVILTLFSVTSTTCLLVPQISGAEYSSASADPVAAFSAAVAEHMNADHAESTVAMVQHCLDLSVSAAEIVDLDQYGMNLIVVLEGEKMKARLPFPRPAESRSDIKSLIVECSRAAAKAT